MASLDGAQVPPCHHCTQLCQQFAAPCAAHLPSPADCAKPLLISDSEDEELPLARSLFHSDAPRGGPRSNETRETLSEWISKHRPGQYKILSCEGKFQSHAWAVAPHSTPTDCPPLGLPHDASKKAQFICVGPGACHRWKLRQALSYAQAFESWIPFQVCETCRRPLQRTCKKRTNVSSGINSPDGSLL